MVTLLADHPSHVQEGRVIISAHYFCSQVADLKDSIVVDGYGDQVYVLALSLQASQIDLHEPFDTDVRNCRLSKASTSHSFIVLEHDKEIFLTDEDLPDERLCQIAFLYALIA